MGLVQRSAVIEKCFVIVPNTENGLSLKMI